MVRKEHKLTWVGVLTYPHFRTSRVSPMSFSDQSRVFVKALLLPDVRKVILPQRSCC